MRSKNIKYNKLPIPGEFTEPITFDYIIENEYTIKLFDFKEKTSHRLSEMHVIGHQ